MQLEIAVKVGEQVELMSEYKVAVLTLIKDYKQLFAKAEATPMLRCIYKRSQFANCY